MIETYTDFLKAISDYLIKGIFISILVIIVARLLFKTKIATVATTQIIKWILIIYACGVLVNTILIFVFPPSEKYALQERINGPYWWAYLLMVSMNSVVPLLLLNNKIGRKLYVILIISLLMNIGWLFESFVIHMTNLHSEMITENYNPYLPNSEERSILIKGLLLGMILLVLENSIKYKRNSFKNPE